MSKPESNLQPSETGVQIERRETAFGPYVYFNWPTGPTIEIAELNGTVDLKHLDEPYRTAATQYLTDKGLSVNA